MFKIESYITPIILSHVEKYVKNIRPQDSQLSLWGGDVAFQNLDLKLEVLEEELNLPVSFLSGHIHELSIHVPWTKIGSEPITITINTIEFVLKLKDADSRNVQNKQVPKKKTPKTEEVPGYMATLINRIANNIAIKCHNIILKFVEEDIVVSMNIQYLSVESADKNWNAAFNEISSTKILVRKIININDLTICLDKRNAAGKIEVCEEPILYKCCLQFRFFRRYNILTIDKSSLTRLELYCKLIDLNISQRQLPMLIRLLDLSVALKLGKLNSSTEVNQQPRDAIESMNNTNTEASMSYLSMAWNLLPTIFPDDASTKGEISDDENFHIMHIGFYVDKLNICFKTQEFLDNLASSSKKIKYNPILKADFGGVYCETISNGVQWSNIIGGIATINISNFGDCPCGNKLTKVEIFQNKFTPKDTTTHIKDSFVDVTCQKEERDYKFSWNVHYHDITENFLLNRTPALAFDILHQVDIPEEMSVSEIGSELEFSNLSEKYLAKFYLGSFEAFYGPDILHRVEQLKIYIESYDYQPYYEPKPIPTFSQLPPASTEDYEALISEVPMRNINIVLNNSKLTLCLWDHTKKKSSSIHSGGSKKQVSVPFPQLSIQMRRLESDITMPMYPNRLIYTTCQLPDRTETLFEKCYTKIDSKIEEFFISIKYDDFEQIILNRATIMLNNRMILLPGLWKHKHDINKIQHDVKIENLHIELSAPQFVICMHLLQSIKDKKFDVFDNELISILLYDVKRNVNPVIEIQMGKILLKQIETEKTNIYKLDITTCIGYTYIPAKEEETNIKSIFLSYPERDRLDNPIESFLQILLQFPKNQFDIIDPPIVIIKLLDGVINIDPVLHQFFFYDLKKIILITDNDEKQSKSDTAILYESPNKPGFFQASASSTDKDLTSIKSEHEPSTDSNYGSFYTFCEHMVFLLEVKQTNIYFPDKSILTNGKYIETFSEALNNTENKDYILFRLPYLSLNSAMKYSNVTSNYKNYPITMSQSAWSKDKNNFPWSLSASNLGISVSQNKTEYVLLEDVTTNVTIAITSKTRLNTNETLSICFHLDTTPIIFNFYKEQVLFLKKFIEFWRNLTLFSKNDIKQNKPQRIEISQRSNSPPGPDLKDIFGATQHSSTESTTIDDYVSTKDESSKLSIWLQWTLTKISLNFMCFNDDTLTNKLIFDLEDLIFSLDKQDVYFKVKTKIGSINGQCYENDKDLLVKNDALSFDVKTENNDSGKTNETFFDIIITKAETGNVHSKWGTLKKNRSLNETLTEVVINMQHIDVRLDLDLAYKFFEIFNPKLENRICDVEYDPEQIQNILSVNDLPLIHFESKGLRVFLPSGNINDNCSVFIFKISRMTISPNVENPINRAPIRPDIYTKAAQMRILTVPGSKIEDRQYELRLKDISLSTANWKEVLNYISSHLSTKNYNNPAFEWNNLQNMKRMSYFDINTIFKDFNFSAIYAPCMIFKRILICGQALEFNCMSDLLFDINTNQVIAGENILSKIKNISGMFEDENECADPRKIIIINTNVFDKRGSSNSIDTKSETYDQPSLKVFDYDKYIKSRTASVVGMEKRSLIDSGLETMGSRKSKHKIYPSLEDTEKNRKIPFEICLVGGIFTVKLYHILVKGSKTKVKNHTMKRLPLLNLSLYQPNMLITQTMLDKTTQMSLFNVALSLGSNIEELTKNTSSTGSFSIDEFNDILIETKIGDLDPRGIRQPFLKVKYQEKLVSRNEVFVELRRPIKVSISHEKMQKVFEIKKSLKSLFMPKNNQKLKPKSYAMSSGGSKFKLIRSLLFNINHYKIDINQLLIETMSPNLYDFKMSFTQINAHLDINDRPERMNIQFELKDFVVSNEKFVIVHPYNLTINTVLTQEYWKREPLIFINLKSTYLQIDVNALNILSAEEMKNAFLDVFNNNNQEHDLLKNSSSFDANQAGLIRIPTPNFRKQKETKEEYYQDDLRAGAFQFVEATSCFDLPLPYQIQIMCLNVDVVCWRYPQPRGLNNVEVYPVPFDKQKLNVACKLEYYSDITKTFRTICDFSLSETTSKVLSLPNQKIAASIWRVVMIQNLRRFDDDDEFFDDDDYEDDDDDEEELNYPSETSDFKSRKRSKLYLHPKIFVGCMRVDSYFSPQIVQNFEIFVDFKHVKFNLLNNISKQFSISNGLSVGNSKDDDASLAKNTHTFFTANITDLENCTKIYDDSVYAIDMGLSLACELIDYGYLSSQPVIDNCVLKSYVELSENEMSISLITNEIKLRYSPSIGHAILMSQKIWKQNMLKENTDSIIFARYIICNNTTFDLQFGQFGTNEMINLPCNSCNQYSFRTTKQQQDLYVISGANTQKDGDVKTTSNPIPIKSDAGIIFIKNEDKYFVINVENISSTQKKIIINGQIQFYNMTSEQFRMQYKLYDRDRDGTDVCSTNQFDLKQNANTSLLVACTQGMEQSLRIKLLSDEKTQWTGEIPLREIIQNSKPWLVKIPNHSKQGHMSCWVRILRENIPNESGRGLAQRVLVVIWPIFVLKSMLTVNTTVYDEKLEQNFSVYGKGAITELQMPGTHEDDHNLLFKMNFSSPHEDEDKRKALLSYNFVDKNTFYTIPEKYSTIENAIAMLGKPIATEWPCSREEEMRTYRDNTYQDITMPVYNCSSSHDLSCALMLNISPWCLFINSLEYNIRLKNVSDDETCIIEKQNIVMPFFIKEAFLIELEVGQAWIQSETIYINSEVKRSVSNCYILPAEGSLLINVKSEFGLTRLLLSIINDNNMKVMILSAQFVVTNLSTYDLKITPYCVASNEKSDYFHFTQYNESSRKYNLQKNEKNSDNVLGNVISTFHDLTKKTSKVKFNSSYNFFITIYDKESSTEFACPVFLNKPQSRKCVNVKINEECIPLSLSIITYQDQTFVSIYDDKYPILAIYNSTDFNIFIAQSETVAQNKTAVPKSETFNDSNSIWHQVVQSKQKIFYTPPCFDERFPDITNTEYALIFACVNADQNIRWSYPVKIDESKHVVMNIPLYGDVKLTINTKSKISEVTFDYISENAEFSVKDIRTRLSNPLVVNDSQPHLNPSSSARRRKSLERSLRSMSPEGISLQEETTVEPKSKIIIFRAFMKALNINLYMENKDNHNVRTEIIAINFEDICTVLDQRRKRLHLDFFNIQVDNQLYEAGDFDFNVIVCGQDIGQGSTVLPIFFEFDDYFEKCLKKALCSIDIKLFDRAIEMESINLKLNPIRAYIEDKYLNLVMDFLMECLPNNLLYEPEETIERIRCPPGTVLLPKIIVHQSIDCSEPFQLRSFTIEPFKMLLSVHTCMRLYIALDHSPLQFSVFCRENINTLPVKFGNTIGLHYLSGAIFGAGWVVGSLEILGSPSGLARSVTTGIRDFVSLPAQGLLRGPWGFFVGVTQGSASLVKNITAGTVNSVTKLAASVARNLDRMTLDSEHVQRTDALRRNRPLGVTEGLTKGLTGLGISLLGAVGGLSKHPLQARSPFEVVTGVGRGIVGAITKPLSGAAELVALTGQGMLNTVGYNTMPLPKTPRRLKNEIPGPTIAKVRWKLLPQIFHNDTIYFIASATMISNPHIKLIHLCLLTTVLVIVDVERDELIDIINLEKITLSTHPEDSNLINLKISEIKEFSPKHDLIMFGHYPISRRTYQYVRDSTTQLPTIESYGNLESFFQSAVIASVPENQNVMSDEKDETGNEAAGNDNINESTGGMDEAVSIDPKTSTSTATSNAFKKDIEVPENKLLTLYIDPNYSDYFMNYLNLLKRSISNSNVFLPFHI